MAIAVDNAGVAIGGTGNLSFALGSGSNRIVVVGTAQISSDITNVTFNGVNMTLLAESATTNGKVEIWYMLEAQLPAAGTYTIAQTGGVADGAKGARSWTGVDQTTPFGTVFQASSGLGVPTVNVTGTATTDIVIDCIEVQEPASLAAGAGQTLGYNQGSGGLQNTTAAGSQEAGNGGTVTMSWTGTADDSRTMAVALKEAAVTAAEQVLHAPVRENPSEWWNQSRTGRYA